LLSSTVERFRWSVHCVGRVLSVGRLE
jgi:hypothetical protein